MTEGPTAVTELYAALHRYVEPGPETVAVRAATASGWRAMSRAEFCADALAAAAGGRALVGRAPVVVLVDGSAESIATIIGLVLAGVDVALVEEQSSYLADPGSAIHRLGPVTVIGPPGGAPVVPMAGAYRAYLECRADARPLALDRDGEVMQMTSGTTGESRLARQPLRNAMHGAGTYRDLFGLDTDDVILTAVPLAHSFGLIGGMLAALVSGTGLWTLPRFGMRSLLAGLDEGATILLGTPLMYQMLTPVFRSRPRPPDLRVALSSGGPLAGEDAAAAGLVLGTSVRQIYGSTETGLIAVQPASAETWPADAVGVAAPGVRLRVEPPDGEGQLFVHTPALFTGYAPDERAAPISADGYYATGDVARIDTEGRVFLIGRKSTFVNVGGRKVNPRRIERILAEHSAVREAYVHGVAPSGREERIEAVVVLDPATPIADLTHFCRARGLLSYEVPHRFHVVDRLPRTPMGKVDQQRVLSATVSTTSEHGRSEG